RDEASLNALANDGSFAVADQNELVGELEKQRAVWVMLPAGAPAVATMPPLLHCLAADVVIIDGGNTLYNEVIRRDQELTEKGLH
ncbi:NAD(P)-binding domain-containing protein, partial [Pseudomonas syringae group genomosp. 7]|uniref:NAD(P)-binding domain-containing protein n=1 Tax=Pseudomonas syringae group genomosp. 7 TaxID=251699 RepID=UPI00376FDC43